MIICPNNCNGYLSDPSMLLQTLRTNIEALSGFMMAFFFSSRNN